jgi:methionyl-tRNA formyltransferase
LLQEVFAINLHASLLPRYRGAAPINWAVMNGEEETGVSVIALADRMDAGDVYAMTRTEIMPHETAGDVHDRLALLGPEIMLAVLRQHTAGDAVGQPQDESLATLAPRLSKKEGTTSFDLPAKHVRNRIHGLTPWPGCTVRIDGSSLRLMRAEVVEEASSRGKPGEVLANHMIACGAGGGVLMLREVQPPGRGVMTWQAYRNGHAVRVGAFLEAME